MARVTTEILVGAAVAPAGTFTIPYPSGTVQADYATPQDVIFDLYGVEITASAAFGASEITVTWPAGAAGDLQPGTYFIDLDTLSGGDLPANVSQAAAVADSTAASGITDSTTGTAGATLAAISGSGADAGINNNFATLIATDVAVEAKLNAVIAALQAAGLMKAD